MGVLRDLKDACKSGRRRMGPAEDSAKVTRQARLFIEGMLKIIFLAGM